MMSPLTSMTLNRRRFTHALGFASLRALVPCLPAASLLPLAACSKAPDPLPRVASGRVERLENLPSRYVDARHVDIWLPASYDGKTRHPVVYLHDGQAVFDGGQAMSRIGWRMDQAVQAWAGSRAVTAPILVAIWNHESERHLEYFPQPMLSQLSRPARERAWESLPLLSRPFAGDLVKEGRSHSEAYLDYLVQEVKPAIDARFATLRDPAHTFLMGSSMGGLISVHGLLRHPETFGAAAALSPHWIGLFERNDEISDAALAWLRQALPSPSRGLRLYLDRGTEEMDAHYAHAHGQVDTLLRERGYLAPQAVSRVVKGAGHNERDWGARAHQVLAFLLDGAVPPTA